MCKKVNNREKEREQSNIRLVLFVSFYEIVVDRRDADDDQEKQQQITTRRVFSFFIETNKERERKKEKQQAIDLILNHSFRIGLLLFAQIEYTDLKRTEPCQ